MTVHVNSETRRNLQVVISESGQPNGRPYRICTTNGRLVNTRRTWSDTAAAFGNLGNIREAIRKCKSLLY